MQVVVAIKKILYAADTKESALEEAQEYLSEAICTGATEVESEVWVEFWQAMESCLGCMAFRALSWSFSFFTSNGK